MNEATPLCRPNGRGRNEGPSLFALDRAVLRPYSRSDRLMATTLEVIQTRMKKLQAQAHPLATKKTAAAMKTIHELMEKHGPTSADISGHAGGKQDAKKADVKAVGNTRVAAAKYRDPKSGATWSGHGRAPQWIATAINRDRFLIDADTATANPASAKRRSWQEPMSVARSRRLSRPEIGSDVVRPRSSAGVAGWCQGALPVRLLGARRAPLPQTNTVQLRQNNQANLSVPKAMTDQ